MDVFTEVMNRFDEITHIPRCSSNEGALRKWIGDWAREHGYASTTDSAGNFRVDIAASSGRETEKTLVLQAHQDMVCQARNGYEHDFAAAGVVAERDGDWIIARDTTLGADNGAGIALMLGVCGKALGPHPPIELLFTSNEESDMSGARGLSPKFVSGRRLLNLDSEDEGLLTMGCAGLRVVDVTVPVERGGFARSGESEQSASITVDGLSGGHSAVDIHRGRANANVLLARLLKFLNSRVGIRVARWKAGSAINMIARAGEVTVAVPAGEYRRFEELVKAASERFRNEYSETDPGVELSCAKIEGTMRPRDTITTASLLAASELVIALPHGVTRIFDSPELGRVRTSVNLAGVELRDREFKVSLSIRGATNEDMDEVQKQVEAIALLAGGRAAVTDGIAPWRGAAQSVVRDRARRAYRSAFRNRIREEIAHGVLECGIMSDRIPDMDMASVGPTIENAHSPGERLSVPSMKRLARFLAEYVSLPDNT